MGQKIVNDLGLYGFIVVDGLGFLGADHLDDLGLLAPDLIKEDGQFFTVGFID